MIFRAVVNFEWHDQRGCPIAVQKGELVDVLMQADADKLLSQSKITHRNLSYADPWGMKIGKPADTRVPVKRIGIWMFTSSWYSGGRIHVFQYAHALAQNGCQVFVMTNQQPKWANDYPKIRNLRILIEGKDSVPPDLDLIMTDSKDSTGMNALIYKRTHPHVPFVCMNFETPNWVARYDKEYAKHLHVNKDVFKHADLFLANSRLSRKYLLEWMEQKTPCEVVPPVVNTHALARAPEFKHDQLEPGRPFAMWSSRSPKYKGGHVALDAILALEQPFDLVTFGSVNMGNRVPGGNHRIVQLKGAEDTIKYAAYKAAHMTLAPSKFEGFGMVPAESLASGTQCLVYDLPVLRQEYGEQEGLIYVPLGDERAFKKKVREVAGLPKPELKRTPIRIRQTLGLDSMVERVEQLPYHHFKTKRISCQLVVYWGFVPESLESIYPYVDEIFIAFGRCPHAEEIDDGSWERLQAFPDPDNKITLKRRDFWSGGKEQMRTWAINQSTGNYMLLLDGDEIWIGLDKWIASDIKYGCPRWLNFWHSDKHWVYDTAKLAGMRWGRRLDPFGSTCPHYRWSWWRKSYSFRAHHALPKDANNEGLHLRDKKSVPEQVPEAIIYHLGHALSKEVMAAKHAFYLGRDGTGPGRKARRDKWHGWNGEVGDCGDGIIEERTWELPDIVQRGFVSLSRIRMGEVVA